MHGWMIKDCCLIKLLALAAAAADAVAMATKHNSVFSTGAFPAERTGSVSDRCNSLAESQLSYRSMSIVMSLYVLYMYTSYCKYDQQIRVVWKVSKRMSYRRQALTDF